MECSVVKPLHVIKRGANSFALVHFATEIDAATFYYIYCTQKKRICIRIEDVKVNPSLIDNHPVNYISVLYHHKLLMRYEPFPTSGGFLTYATLRWKLTYMEAARATAGLWLISRINNC
ncbi:hypothetical protein MAM1_0063d03889 [Mucor ambiguus]|uniref:Uncharacterized protein n=1 Tax=Mucor ambiguus TaxID=91626 RepID=A0A0C9MAR4_9FUNG|nr:hypothetical protein MAM1_0063d03889 [Mucor ambiguus]